MSKRVVILSGPSGAGKTTLYQKLLQSRRLKGALVRSISATTRPPRPGERHGREYLFLSEKMFFYKLRAGHFLESQKVFHYYYGTLNKTVRDILGKGKSVLLCIDVKGAQVVWKKYPQAFKIFIKPPSLTELEKRLRKRGTETPRDLAKRLETARRELAQEGQYDAVIVNDRLAASYRRLEQVLSVQLLSPQRSRLRAGSPGGR